MFLTALERISNSDTVFPMRIHRSSLAMILAALSGPLALANAFGCTCVPPPHGVAGARQLAEWRAGRADVIFEGTVADSRLKSKFLDAPVGSLVPATLDPSSDRMRVTFSETRFYKGKQAGTVEVETGIGGGDCGSAFEPGRRYLVYANKDDHGGLSTGICAATAPIEESGSNLAYLRGEPVPPEDGTRRRNAQMGELSDV